MDTKNGLHVKKETPPSESDRVVHQLRIAAAGRGQTAAERDWIRAATRC